MVDETTQSINQLLQLIKYNVMFLRFSDFNKGLFTYYVSQNGGFVDPPPPLVSNGQLLTYSNVDEDGVKTMAIQMRSIHMVY